MDDSNFPGLGTTFPLLIEIKSEDVGDELGTFGDSSLSQQIDLLLDGTISKAPPPDSEDETKFTLTDLLKYNKKIKIEDNDDDDNKCNDKTDDNDIPPDNNTNGGVINAKQDVDEELKCITCNEKFDLREIYEIHLAGHANNMKCPVCNMVLKSLRNYEKHCVRCKPYECQICGRVVRFRPNFIKHMRVHSTEQSKRHKYKCEICSKEFMSFEYFKVHKKIHNGNVNLTCNVCGKVFSALASLRGHSKLHTGIKLHKCEFCGKGFGQRYNLKIHVRVHTGELPHKCKICRRKLHSLESYQNHMQKNHQNLQDGSEPTPPPTPTPIPPKTKRPKSATKIINKKATSTTTVLTSEVTSTVLIQVPLATIYPPLETIVHVHKTETTDIAQISIDEDNNILDPSSVLIGNDSESMNQATILDESDLSMKNTDDSNQDIVLKGPHEEKLLSDITNISPEDSKFPPDFDNDLVDSSDLTPSLSSYSNLFVPDEMYLDEHDGPLRLDQNYFDLQSTTDGNFIRKEWVYSNYSVGDKFDDDDFFDAASFIYD